MGPHKSINDSTANGWYGMNMADIRRIEAETKEMLDKERATGQKRGHEEAKEWNPSRFSNQKKQGPRP